MDTHTWTHTLLDTQMDTHAHNAAHVHTTGVDTHPTCGHRLDLLLVLFI